MKIAIRGAELAVERRDGTRPEFPALLFIHGFPLDHLLWRHQLAELDAWTRIAPDLRGAGQSSVPADPAGYSTARYADDLAELLDALEIADVVACGLSMGGYVLLELLRRHPARVRAAVLCNTKAEADTPEARAGRDEMVAVAREGGAAAVAAKMLPKMVSSATAKTRPDVVAEVRAMMERAPLDGIVGALHALRERPDHTGTLPGLRLPVLVVAGADDQIIPAETMRRMAAAIPRSELVLIKEAGHLAPLEQPRQFAAALRVWLDRLG